MRSRVVTSERGDTASSSSADRWEEAYRTLGPALLTYLRRLSRDQWRAEELLQEVFARAMDGRPVPASELRPWLYRIATNLAIDESRRGRRFAFLPFAGNETAPTADHETSELVRVALRAIPSDQAVALVLRLHEGFTRAEVARIVGASEDAVKSRLARGRRNFAAAYGRLQRGLKT